MVMSLDRQMLVLREDFLGQQSETVTFADKVELSCRDKRIIIEGKPAFLCPTPVGLDATINVYCHASVGFSACK